MDVVTDFHKLHVKVLTMTHFCITEMTSGQVLLTLPNT